jgi:hypothetical protein
MALVELRPATVTVHRSDLEAVVDILRKFALHLESPAFEALCQRLEESTR